MARWEIAETRRLIELRHGPAQLHLARYCLRSATDRQAHARYHFQEAKKILAEHIDARLDTQSIYDLTWPTDPESWGELTHCLMKAEANIIACAQCVHSLGDILAHVVYYGLGLNLQPRVLRERDVSLSNVHQKVSGNLLFAEVAGSLAALASDDSYKSLDAVVNHSKHRGLVGQTLSVEPTGSNEPYALEFGAFSYRDIAYAGSEVQNILAPAYEMVSRAVVATGNALNRALLV